MAKNLICAAPDCEKPHHAHGYCSMHGTRLKRWGTLADKSVPSLLENFEALLTPEPNSGCWLWIGNQFSMSRGGYGCFTSRPHSVINKRAHRAAWELYKGPVASCEHVLHRCHNALCVNPDHLFLGNQASSMAYKVSKGRQNKGEDHGRHKLTEHDAIAIILDTRKQKDISYDYGVSVPTVSDIKRGRSWRHLTP